MLTLRYQAIRRQTEYLIRDLSAEDRCIQSMPDASPAKWHLAHTTWFFEEFLLRPNLPSYVPLDPEFRYLFNSYYEQVGSRHPRAKRGMITRPGSEAVSAYRSYVDMHMLRLLDTATEETRQLVILGLQHEQQHQELLLTDALHAFAQNPLCPAVDVAWQEPAVSQEARMIPIEGGILRFGTTMDRGFAFDNETPTYEALLPPYWIADTLVRNAEFQAFIEDGGYQNASLWMADGWAMVQQHGWTAPLYWRQDDRRSWLQMGPGGLRPMIWESPVRHISWYEAEAYARWKGARLPTEQEWEAAASNPALRDIYDCVWQWTASAYLPYPRFRAQPGAIGEYNGKFMINQMVLRGGSCATPPGHARPTYRNFFPPDARWQFSGLRLAADY